MASITGDDLTWNGEPLPPRVPRLLRDALAKVRAGQLRTDRPLLRVDDQGPKPYVLVWNVSDQTQATNRAIIGLVADSALLGDIFARILKESPLLPPSLGETHELLSVKVSNDAGHEVFSSSAAWSPYASETVLESELGDLRLGVALRPSASEHLIIGG